MIVIFERLGEILNNVHWDKNDLSGLRMHGNQY